MSDFVPSDKQLMSVSAVWMYVAVVGRRNVKADVGQWKFLPSISFLLLSSCSCAKKRLV